MEKFISTLILIHASLGGVSLIAGSLSMLFKKGSKNHKLSGKIFSICLLIAATLAIPVTFSPGHESPFLFLIATFTIYLILTGNRALLHKRKTTPPNFIDQIISGAMLLFSLALIGLGIRGFFVETGQATILFLFFGIASGINCVQDFFYYQKQEKLTSTWLRQHIRRIMGAFIASTTAFLITALNSNHWITWITPSIIGTIVIIYWVRKVSKRPKSVEVGK